ncbi:MAG TPA: hypothetical protein VJ385_05125 [Fibrobacteria bacterium]|nr:hypothetical protein [Fibrobacteria bacterium]
MKQAVVFHLPSSNWAVIDEYLSRSGQHALVTAEDALRAPEIARHAGRSAALAAILPPKDLQSVDEYVRSVLDRSPFLFVGKEWEALCAKHGLPADALRQSMRQDLAEEWGAGALLVESLERALQQYAIRAVVLNEEYSAEARTLALWAGQRKIPVLHLYQGLALDGHYAGSGDLLADSITAAGPRAAETFQDMGLPAGRVIQTGNPAWMKFSELSAMKEDCRAGLARLIGWGSGPLVVFGTSEGPVKPATSDPEILSQAARAFFRCAREAARTHPGSIWAVLLRPSDPPFLERELTAWAAEEGLPAGRIHFFRNDSELFLAAAEAVVSVDSGLAVEALLAGTQAINVLTDSGWRAGPAFAADTGVIEVAPEGLYGEVMKALERRPPDPRRLEAARSAYHPRQNGDPVKNVVDWISGMLSPDP